GAPSDHRGGRRRVSADRRLRLPGRRPPGGPHLCGGAAGHRHHPRRGRLGPSVSPGGPAGRGHLQQLHPEEGGAAISSNGGNLLDVRNISKYFGSVIALKDVSMHCRAGEVTCLLGDNGAGKSTLIKTLSGVYRPDEGDYLFDGRAREFTSPRDALDLGIAT